MIMSLITVRLFVTFVPILYGCSAIGDHFQRFAKRNIETNPFLQGKINVNNHPNSNQYYPKNPFFSSLAGTLNNPTTNSHFYANNPFLQSNQKSASSSDADVCGVSFRMRHLMVNSDEYAEGGNPWLAAIFLGKELLLFRCGGTLVSERHVITAAHCIVIDDKTLDSQDVAVSLGKFDLQNIAISDSSVYKVQTVHRHPDYKEEPISADADIAVLELQRKVGYSNLIKAACLWAKEDNLNDVVGQLGIVSGWGKTENGMESLHRPKEAKLPIVTQDTCIESHRQFKSVISGRTFCAGFKNGAAPCTGDSGGPFVIEKDGKYALRGVVSLSVNSDKVLSGCDLKYYVVFTDVSKFLPWIIQVTR